MSDVGKATRLHREMTFNTDADVGARAIGKATRSGQDESSDTAETAATSAASEPAASAADSSVNADATAPAKAEAPVSSTSLPRLQLGRPKPQVPPALDDEPLPPVAATSEAAPKRKPGAETLLSTSSGAAPGPSGSDAAPDASTSAPKSAPSASAAPAAAPPTGLKPAPVASPAASTRSTSAEGGRGGRSGEAATPPAAGPGAAPAGPIGVRVAQAAPGDPAMDRTRVGVGEQVTFSGGTGGRWSASAATGAATGDGAEYSWTAPDTAQSVTITHAPATGATRTVQMTVVAPQRIEFRKSQDVPQVPAGAGMTTNLTFHPLNVSFSRAEWLEARGPASAVTGYFAMYRALNGSTLAHDSANAEWIPMGTRNNGADDYAFIAGKPPLPLVGYMDGAYEWSIPNKYRVGGSGEGHEFETTLQRHTINTAGGVTVTKGGQSVTQSRAGVVEGTGSDLLLRFPTVAEAAAVLEADGIVRGLRHLATARERDPESYRNLIAAARLHAAHLYIALRCNNSYSWVYNDTGTLAVSGGTRATRSIEMPSNGLRNIRIPFSEVFNLESFNSATSLNFVAVIEGHTLTADMTYPFTGMGEHTMLNSSNGRYSIRSFIVDRAAS